VTAIGATSQVLSKLESAPETQDTNPLSVVIGRWDTLSAKRQQAVDAAQAAEQQLQLCTETVQAFIKQNPKCATCGGDLDSATLLSSALDAHTHASPAAGGDGASS
jgi:exonuclease SbcC